MNRIKIPLCIALLGLASTSVVALAQDGESQGPGYGAPDVSSVQEPAAEAMAVLARPRVAGDAMPSDAAAAFAAKGRFGVNPYLSRRAIGSISNSVYVLPADGYVCASLTIGEGAAMTCVETDRLAANESGPGTASLPGDALAVYGIVPDGVESVLVGTGQTDTQVVPTENNAYFTVLPSGVTPRSVSIDGPSGRVDWPIYDPDQE